MTAKKNAPRHNSRETKKAIVLNSSKNNKIPLIIAVVVAMAVAGGLGLFLFPGGGTPPADDAGSVAGTPRIDDGRLTYAVSLFADGKARHFKYADADSNITIGYFILKSTDGVIRAAFDACDVCWQAGKGYYQEGASMVCRNCGRRFESVKVNEVKGGCNPAPLERAIEGDQVVIRVEDIKKGAAYFNFSAKA
jgi:uncharacterized membrane protein